MSDGLTQFNPASHLIWFAGFAVVGVLLLLVASDFFVDLRDKLRNRKNGIPDPSANQKGGAGSQLHNLRRLPLPWRTWREGRPNDPPVKPPE